MDVYVRTSKLEQRIARTSEVPMQGATPFVDPSMASNTAQSDPFFDVSTVILKDHRAETFPSLKGTTKT